MSGEIEAAGALATAGLAAREFDKTGKSHGHESGGDCKNCGTKLTGHFCHVCGQSGHVERKLSHAFEELLHGIVHFDGKAWRTLPMLLVRPGTLTRNYIHGMRVRYISPVALFLFTVFLMFFVFALMGDGLGSGALGGSTPRTLAQLQANVAEARTEVAEAEKEVAVEQAELDRLLAAPDKAEPGEIAGQRGTLAGANGTLTGAKATLDSAERDLKERQDRLAQLRKVLERLNINEADAKAKNDSDSLSEIATAREILNRELARPEGPSAGVTATINEDGKVNVNLSAASQDGMQSIFDQIKEANQRGAVEVNTGNEEWNKKIRHKLENPELAWYKIQNTAYKFSFLLVPISLPFLWLMFFWKRGVTLYDHIVFSLYSLSFMSLLFLVLALLSRLPEGVMESAAISFTALMTVAIPVHMFFHLKGTYSLGWFSAFWRMALLTCLLLWITLSIFIVAIFMLGLLG